MSSDFSSVTFTVPMCPVSGGETDPCSNHVGHWSNPTGQVRKTIFDFLWFCFSRLEVLFQVGHRWGLMEADFCAGGRFLALWSHAEVPFQILSCSPRFKGHLLLPRPPLPTLGTCFIAGSNICSCWEWGVSATEDLWPGWDCDFTPFNYLMEAHPSSSSSSEIRGFRGTCLSSLPLIPCGKHDIIREVRAGAQCPCPVLLDFVPWGHYVQPKVALNSPKLLVLQKGVNHTAGALETCGGGRWGGRKCYNDWGVPGHGGGVLGTRQCGGEFCGTKTIAAQPPYAHWKLV